MKERTKSRLAVSAFIGSLAFGVAGFCCPPIAIIDSSVLWFTAQMLLFCSALLGINLNLGKWGSNERKEASHDSDA